VPLSSSIQITAEQTPRPGCTTPTRPPPPARMLAGVARRSALSCSWPLWRHLTASSTHLSGEGLCTDVPRPPSGRIPTTCAWYFERRPAQLTGHRIQWQASLLCEATRFRVLGPRPAIYRAGTSWHGRPQMLSRHRAAPGSQHQKSRALSRIARKPLYDYTDHRVYLSWADIVKHQSLDRGRSEESEAQSGDRGRSEARPQTITR